MTWRKSFTRTLAGALLLLAAADSVARADSPSARVILVLDASGSMWGRIADRPKIEIARRVIRELKVLGIGIRPHDD